MLDRRHVLGLLSVSAAASALQPHAALAQAAAAWPNRFVRLIVPFPPGGGTDAIARVVAIKLSQIWGHEMVIENKGGGATSIGTDAVAKAEPDGYTVLLQSVPLAVNKFLFASLPFDPVADLAPVSLICDYPNVMCVPMSLPVTTVREFIDYAKANPGKATYASSGYGTSVHLSGELFNRMAGVELRHIPYRGAGPAFNDLIPGRVDVMFNNIGSVVPFIKGGKLRALGVTSLKRNASLPDVPTVAEAGVPGFEVIGFYAFFAPARTPPPIIAKFHADTVKALSDPVIRQRLDQLGVGVIGSSPDELRGFLKSEMDKWGPLIKSAGIKAE
jgi:tripartite-type tricarboxylate transporter receptor subunit TctC